MICLPNAKINLGLHVTGKRADGYHNIETCFYPVPLRDALEIVPASVDAFTQTGIIMDSPPENNLALKALHLFRQHHEVAPLSVFLHKAIPVGAGLGGGSADAAFMLKMLRAYTSQNLSNEELEAMAVEIGADCPFFIRNKPVIATGIGDIFESIALSLKGFYLCIIKPNLYISTREAYAMVKPAKPPVPLKEILQMPVQEWRHHLKNDFEPGISQQYPVIAEIKESLYARDAVYAAMSGSGSAVFGLFEKNVELSFPGCFSWKCLLQ